MMVGLDVWAPDQIDAARVDDDEAGARAKALLEAGGEDGMGVGRVGPDDNDHVGLVDRLKVLRAGRSPVCLRKSEAGRRVADAGAGVDIVVAEAHAHELLDQKHLFVRAARGADRADKIAPVPSPNAPEFARRTGERLVPRDLPPRILDPRADHRLENPVLVRGVAIGEAALDAGMAFVGLARLLGDHTQDFVALQFRLEGAADATIGAGRDHGALGRSLVDHRLFIERRRRAGLHAGAAGDALGRQEIDPSGRDCRAEAAAENRQSKGSLHFRAGAHAA